MEGGKGGEARGVVLVVLLIIGSINVQDGRITLFMKTIHGSRSKIRLLCRLFTAGKTADPWSEGDWRD